MPRKLFVTTALPYANAPFHVGHMMEYIQADIWVRFQRMQGHQVHFVCADDAHGAAMMIAADKAGQTPQEFVAKIAAGRQQYLDGFHIALRSLALDRLARERGAVAVDLPRAARRRAHLHEVDRAVLRPGQGHVPGGPLHQGHLPGVRRQGPVRRQLRGLRLDLRADRTQGPVLGAHRREAGAAQLRTLLLPPVRSALRRLPAQLGARQRPAAARGRQQGARVARRQGRRRALADWDISRDAPYFGIPIPDTKDKYFYVWLDAPVGYLASLKAYFDAGKAKAKGETRSFAEFIADAGRRAGAFHRQGHHLLPHAVLAGDAALRRTQGARPDQRARLHHRERREDEQEPRHRESTRSST